MADLGTAVLALYFRAKAVGDRLLARSGQSTASLGVLRSLALEGPQTVSQIARSRPVARQGVQRLADKLTKEGLTEYAVNPNHRRAQLLRLTPQGARIARDLLARQARWTDQIASGMDVNEIQTTMRVLQRLNQWLKEGEDWLSGSASALPKGTPRDSGRPRSG